MIATKTMWIVIISVSLCTFAIRALFLVPRRSAEPGPGVLLALRMIPPAALAALVVPALLRPEGRVELVSPGLLAGVLAGLVAWRTRSITATIGVGLVSVVILQQLAARS